MDAIRPHSVDAEFELDRQLAFGVPSGSIPTLRTLVSGSNNGIRVGAPKEGLGLAVIVLGDKAVDGALEIDDGAEHAMPQAPAGELGEEALHRVQPRARGGRGVNDSARVPREPFPDLGMLVGGIIIEDDVNRLAGKDVALEHAPGSG